jgi:DNA transformation protein
MPVHPDFARHCTELLSSVGKVEGKRMFGGHGLYVDGVFVAIIAGDTLYLKADAQTQSQFAQAGCMRFEYTARGKQHEANYWSAPPEAMDSPALMEPWARLAMQAALRAGAGKRAR